MVTTIQISLYSDKKIYKVYHVIPVMDITTIKLNKQTKDRIDKLRSYRRESYDDILQKILEILNLVRTEPDRARSKLVAIDKLKASEKK